MLGFWLMLFTIKLHLKLKLATIRRSIRNFSEKHHLLKPFNSGLQAIEVWFTDQNCTEIEDKINLTLTIR